MGWRDLLQYFQELQDKNKPATTGIHGSPKEFNRRKTAFYQKHLNLVKSYLESLSDEN